MARLPPETLFARLDRMIDWAKHEKTALASTSTGPVDVLPTATFWRAGSPCAVIQCLEPEYGDDLTDVVGTGVVHLHPECVCVVMEGENPEKGTCVLGFATDGLTVVEARAFYSTVENVPVFGKTDRAPLAVSEFHPLAVGLVAPFAGRARPARGDVETLARALPRHRVEDLSTGEAFGPSPD